MVIIYSEMLKVEKPCWSILLFLCFISKSTGNEIQCSALICQDHQEECRQLDNLCKCTPILGRGLEKIGDCYSENSQQDSFAIYINQHYWGLEGSEQNVDPNSLNIVFSSLKRKNNIGMTKIVLGMWNTSNLPIMNATILNVWNCSLSDVTGDGYKHFPRLRLLRLHNNLITKIPNFPQLETLVLRNNLIQHINVNHFRHFASLLNLYLDNNLMKTLDPRLFQHLTSLLRLEISNNAISMLPSSLFRYNNKLDYLDISNNKISHLEPDLFSYSHELRYLKLGGNKLTFLPQELLHNVIHLNNLNISNNYLHEIPREFLLNAKNLETFDASNNQITNISISLFDQTKQLLYMDLSSNKLSYLPENLFVSLKELRTLHLQNNQLTKLSENLFPARLSSINIGNNNLTHLPKYIFRNITTLMDIKLNDNQFTQVPFLFSNSQSSLRYDLSNNKITSLAYPLNIDAPFTQLMIDLSNNCIQHFYDSEVLYNYRVEEFVCNNCCLSHIISQAVAAKRVSLKHNNISTLDEIFTASPGNLNSLDLSFNPIKLQVLHEISQNPQLMEGKLFTFKETSIQCDCNLIPVLNELKKRSFRLNEVDCWDSKSSKFVSIFEFDQVKCFPQSSVSIYLWIFLPTIFVITIIGISLSLFYKFKPEILYFMFIRGICLRFVTEEDLSKDKVYDAFISYASQDQDWVNDSLVVPLQTGVTKYKLCLHGRDWVGGEWITDQIIRSISTSRRTIMVLSENYLNSYWSRLEFDCAYQQTLIDPSHRLIVVLPGGLPDLSNINEEFRRFIQLTTYLDYNKPYFWSKLKSSLPRRSQMNDVYTPVDTNIEPGIEMTPTTNQ